jgi:hypothetical protein
VHPHGESSGIKEVLRFIEIKETFGPCARSMSVYLTLEEDWNIRLLMISLAENGCLQNHVRWVRRGPQAREPTGRLGLNKCEGLIVQSNDLRNSIALNLICDDPL